MPAYDYTCQDCNTSFEVRSTVTNYEKGIHAECPTCHSTHVKRNLSSVSFASGKKTESNAAPAGHSCGCGGHCGCH